MRSAKAGAAAAAGAEADTKAKRTRLMSVSRLQLHRYLTEQLALQVSALVKKCDTILAADEGGGGAAAER